jgi:hypothetical protein
MSEGDGAIEFRLFSCLCWCPRVGGPFFNGHTRQEFALQGGKALCLRVASGLLLAEKQREFAKVQV